MYSNKHTIKLTFACVIFNLIFLFIQLKNYLIFLGAITFIIIKAFINFYKFNSKKVIKTSVLHHSVFLSNMDTLLYQIL